MTRVKETIARHDKGYNCAQSVACTYADLVGLDEATMFKVTEGLGKGMGGTLATCGALSGACVLAGMKRSTGNLEAPDSKLETYKLAEE
ncbi:MAG: C_GCAxxG_C_C family protein, partial [Acidaminococcaceae bacterium]|nr:C_GCAxxG_C_C family protein [Acidaminococcaceae bacterium]